MLDAWSLPRRYLWCSHYSMILPGHGHTHRTRTTGVVLTHDHPAWSAKPVPISTLYTGVGTGTNLAGNLWADVFHYCSAMHHDGYLWVNTQHCDSNGWCLTNPHSYTQSDNMCDNVILRCGERDRGKRMTRVGRCPCNLSHKGHVPLGPSQAFESQMCRHVG